MIQIGNRRIDSALPPFFIADIAANHNGDIHLAYQLIEKAKESGADAAKFQNFKAEKIVSDSGFRSLKGQVSHQASWKKSVYEVYKDASLPAQWSILLKQKCDEVGIEYMTSPYDFANVDLAEPYVNAYKIGSGDITWLEMLRYIAKKNKPVLLATGASSMEDVCRAVECFDKNKLVLMQCNTNYTASDENFKYINLMVLKTYEKTFPGVVLGLSDHTKGHETVLGAIALGARVIEKHFTLDSRQEGPDHAFSMEPRAFKEMVDAGHKLYAALGDGVKQIEDNEKQTAIVQRRGLYYTRDINADMAVSLRDVEALRPALPGGYEPWQQGQVVGGRLTRKVKKGAAVYKEDFA